MLIQGKRLMPEAVSDLDDTCAPSHPPLFDPHLPRMLQWSLLDPGEGEVAWSKLR